MRTHFEMLERVGILFCELSKHVNSAVNVVHPCMRQGAIIIRQISLWPEASGCSNLYPIYLDDWILMADKSNAISVVQFIKWRFNPVLASHV